MSEVGDRDRANTYAYLFEAKGVQRYIFDSGPLRDLVGASDLVAGLAAAGRGDSCDANGEAGAGGHLEEDLIGRVRQAVLPNTLEEERPQFSRRAGGSFCLHGENKRHLDDIRALWRLTAMLSCPGLEMSEALVPADGDDAEKARLEAIQRVYEAGSGLRENSAAQLAPAGHPYTHFVPRTGRPATGIVRYLSDPNNTPDDVLVDALTQSQRRHSAALSERGSADRVSARFLGPRTGNDGGLEYRFPRNLASGPKEPDTLDNPQFPFGEETRVAVVHADISGLGRIFQNASRNASGIGQVFDLGRQIEAAVEAAAQAATQEVLLGNSAKEAVYRSSDGNEHKILLVPARPVLLGGDDITILVRADLALRFAEKLLAEIEFPSERGLAPDGADLGKAVRLSACAGVAIVKRSQPFLMAHALAEDLCKFAKRAVKAVKKDREAPYPSALAFHVVGTTLQENYDEAILPREMTANGIALTANPYWLGKGASGAGHVTFSDLYELARVIEALGGRGALREMRTQAFVSKEAADALWLRWREVCEGNEAVLDEKDRLLPKLDQALRATGIDDPGQWALAVGSGKTALFDALDLLDIGTDVGTSNGSEPAA